MHKRSVTWLLGVLIGAGTLYACGPKVLLGSENSGGAGGSSANAGYTAGVAGYVAGGAGQAVGAAGYVGGAGNVPCNYNSDCPPSLVCYQGRCNVSPCAPDCARSCSNGIFDGAETDIDCGGPDCPPCALEKHCTTNSDCITNNCKLQPSGPDGANVCFPAESCHDGVQDQDETDVDCGGTICGGCVLQSRCLVNADCQSHSCLQQPDKRWLCSASCTDGIQNRDETDIDCGGTSCAKCEVGKLCNFGGDCASGSCLNARCAAASCADGVKNGAETDVDCGGGTCPGCGFGKVCIVQTDCGGGYCSGGICIAP